MNTFLVRTNFDRVLTVRAEHRHGALQAMKLGLSMGEIVVELVLL